MDEATDPSLTPIELLETLGLMEFCPQRLSLQTVRNKTFSLPDLQSDQKLNIQQLPWYFLQVKYSFYCFQIQHTEEYTIV